MRTLLVITLLCCRAFADENTKPERQVLANVLISKRDPKIRIELPNRVLKKAANDPAAG